MSDREIFVTRLVRLPVVGPEGVPIGRIDDVVLTPAAPASVPRVLGFVADVQRRHIFVNANRIDDIGPTGARMVKGTVDLRRFEQRPGELLARGDIIDLPFEGLVVNDLGLVRSTGAIGGWEVSSVALATGGLLRRRTGKVLPWYDARAVFDAGPMGRHLTALRELHPADVAASLAHLPQERRQALAEAMEDDRLADLLEELPEEEQIEIIKALDLARAADVLEEMDPDDAADLLAEMTAAEREEFLDAMEPQEARPLRRLLRYQGNTAGGLMTPEPLILSPTATVAEALARMRDPDLPASTAGHIFVVEPPTETPTGRYLGTIGFQRMLREAPSTAVADCLDDGPEAISPDLPEAEVARRLASYDVIALPVCDAAGRLVGAVTVDDVLDHVLPADWRRKVRPR
ncbi:MAG: magnesium transporter MgtE N-terminal domain-containing protein [Acidimicrobiales bacterium]